MGSKRLYKDLFYKDMSKEGLEKLTQYGFERHTEGKRAYWVFPKGKYYGNLELYEQYETNEECTGEPRELVICNGEFDLCDDPELNELTVDSIEVICQLYRDGLVEFREKAGTSYEIMKGRV